MDAKFVRNVILKGLALFFAINLVFVPMPDGLGIFSLYNNILEGRERLPFGEDSENSYNLSLYDLDAMFASHVISAGPKPEDEFRVVLLGDSSVWGTLLRPDETLTGILNASNLTTCDDREIRFYNIGYPTISLLKDLMMMDYAMRYEPDLVIWLVTPEAFPNDKQMASPLVANNADRVNALIDRYDLPLDSSDPALDRQSFWDKTLIGRRRSLADRMRLQLYGILWSATGIDQTYPEDYQRAQTDFDEDVQFHNSEGPLLEEASFSFDLLKAGMQLTGNVPTLLVNEPILISSGKNSHLRYNFLYPRWAYDGWRIKMQQLAEVEKWDYIDLWNLIPASEFTNSAIHLTPAGEAILAEEVKSAMKVQICP